MSQITVCDACTQPLPKGLEQGVQLRMPGEEFDNVLLVLPAGGANICPTCIATKVTVEGLDDDRPGVFTAEKIDREVAESVLRPFIDAAVAEVRMSVQQPAQAPRRQGPNIRPVPRQQPSYGPQAGLNPVMPTDHDLALAAQMRARQAAAQRQTEEAWDDDDPEFDSLAQQYGQIAHQPPMAQRPPMGMGLLGM